jgi:hypothetical protein
LSVNAFGQPWVVRLPFAIELELAALRPLGAGGSADAGRSTTDGDPSVRRGNGCAANRQLTAADFEGYGRGARRADGTMDPGRWPSSAIESAARGDQVPGLHGNFIALDFGVREWVLDLPRPAEADESHARMLDWIQDHHDHLEKIGAIAAGESLGLLTPLSSQAVLRGTAWGEAGLTGLSTQELLTPPPVLHPALPMPLSGAESGISAAVAGVVRCVHVERDGSLFQRGDLDPHVLVAGFRLAGGERFVRAVREH